MDAPTIFLLIFAVSFVMTLLSFILGVADISIGGHGAGDGGDLHVGHADGVHLDGPHIDGHGIHFDSLQADGAPGVDAGHGTHVGGISPFNMATALAFFTWFGGAGYLFTAHFAVLAWLAILLSVGVGLVGAALVFTFMVRVLLPGQTPYLAAEDYALAGTIGRLTSSIRAGGTGEMVYSKGGTRRVMGARSEDGSPLPRDAEVVVVRHEGAIAYVEPLAAFMDNRARESARR